MIFKLCKNIQELVLSLKTSIHYIWLMVISWNLGMHLLMDQNCCVLAFLKSDKIWSTLRMAAYQNLYMYLFKLAR